MKSYYFLSTSLPMLKVGTTLEISYEELSYLYDLNLTERDKELFTQFKRWIDLKNLRLYFLNKPFDPRGNLNPKEMEEAIEVGRFFPAFVGDFLKREETVEEKLAFFPYLYAKFLQKEERGFAGEYFRFERELRLVLTALRARSLDRDLLYELRYEDPQDFFIADMLAEYAQGEYIPPREYFPVKELYEKHLSNPKALYNAMLKFRVRWIEEYIEKKPFSIDFLIGYFAKFLLVEDWDQLDKKKGQAILESIVA